MRRDENGENWKLTRKQIYLAITKWRQCSMGETDDKENNRIKMQKHTLGLTITILWIVYTYQWLSSFYLTRKSANLTAYARIYFPVNYLIDKLAKFRTKIGKEGFVYITMLCGYEWRHLVAVFLKCVYLAEIHFFSMEEFHNCFNYIIRVTTCKI